MGFGDSKGDGRPEKVERYCSNVVGPPDDRQCLRERDEIRCRLILGFDLSNFNIKFLLIENQI